MMNLHRSSPAQTEINEIEAAEVLLRRRRARSSLLGFTQYTYPQYKADPVHQLIASTLDKVVSGDIKRLMIFAPPQNGKSELVSVRLPAYWLGRRPNDPVILTSYGASLAENKSRQARNLVESEEYKRLFGEYRTEDAPVDTARDSRAVNHWRLCDPYRGSLLAAGVDGPVTGNGGLLGIIDDPFENWKAAQSETVRKSVWEWWQGTFRTRIWEGGAIVLIMTRWHELDLAGKLLNQQGDKWTVLRLPASAETQEERDAAHRFLGLPLGQSDPLGREPGEPLAPSRFSKEALEELKYDVGPAAWAAEYQAIPRPAEGDRFKRSWFQIVHAVPKNCDRVRYWDKAGTQGGGAYTAGVLVAKSSEGAFFIEDVVRGQWSAAERERIIKQTAELDAQKYGKRKVKIFIEQEPGSGGKESADNTVKNLAGHRIEKDRPSGDKNVRLEPLAAQLEILNVWMLAGEWNRDFIEEFVSIPNGAYRDQSDAAGAAFNKLNDGTKSVGKRVKHGLWQR
jgi:predicted phage terminase large subunit-like protein